MTVQILRERMGPPLWRRECIPVPAPRAKERLAQKLEKAERAGIERAFELCLRDWEVSVVFQDVIAGITWKNPRTGAKFCSHGIYYSDKGEVMQSEWALG
jgi:hypothetical protein